MITLPPHTIVGPQLSPMNLSMGYHTLVIIIGFHPGGLHRLLRVPMCEMVNQFFDASQFWEDKSELVTQQLAMATSFDQMVMFIQHYFIKMLMRLKPNLPIDRVLIQMIKDKKNYSIDELALQSCVSNRQLERQYMERIGLAPKVFSRLVRFTNARALHAEQPEMTWFNIAVVCGYADQMHLIREFKEFAGTTPGALQNDLKRSSIRLLDEYAH